MVKPSLLTKAYLYMLVALLVLAPVTLSLARAISHRGQEAGFAQMMSQEADFAAHELELGAREGPPDRARLAEVGQALRFHLTFVPWGAGGYPGALARVKALGELQPFHGQRWVRLDVAGKPIGALLVEAQPPPGSPPQPPIAWIAGWLALVAGLMLPPFLFWVLRPLRAMVGTAHRLGLGDLDAPVPVTRADEFGELERAFEHLRRRVQAMLTQRERLLTDISHELRAPLQRMNLVLPLLRQQGADGELTGMMEADIRAVDEMLGELLAYMRAQRTEPLRREAVDLADVGRELLAARRLVVETRGVAVESGLAPAPVQGEPRMLARALGNVLDNALKFTPRGGHVTLTSGVDGARAWVEVADDGPGIPAADLPHLFEPFYRPDTSRSRETGGTGLGLAIVRTVVDAHAGDVTLASVEGQGTRVRLLLPRA